MADRVMGGLARLLIRVFFRRVEVEGEHGLPRESPMLVVANHMNGLVDGLLLIAALGRYPRFLGKATLWRILPLRPFLRLAGVVPVYRAKDGEGMAGNDESFRRCRELLERGGVVAIFPEGISHDETSLQPLRTGAARIALGAAFEADAKGLVIAPVGLIFDAKARFRSRALVEVGAPVAVGRWRDRYAADPRDTVRRVTDDIAASLRAVAPDYATLEQAATYGAVADIVAVSAGGRGPIVADLADREDVARRLARVEASGRQPDGLAGLLDAHAVYRRDLGLLGITDADIAAGLTGGRFRSTVAWSVLKAVITAPLALVGWVVHVVPYQIVKQLARLPRNEGVKSTVKLLASTLLFTILWSTLAVLAGLRWGWPAALAVFVGCPAAGYTAVRFAERVRDAGGLVRGYRTLRSREATLASVRANRDRVVALAGEVLNHPIASG